MRAHTGVDMVCMKNGDTAPEIKSESEGRRGCKGRGEGKLGRGRG